MTVQPTDEQLLRLALDPDLSRDERLVAVGAAVHAIEQLRWDLVQSERAAGTGWRRIAAAVGTSHQAAWERFTRDRPARVPPSDLLLKVFERHQRRQERSMAAQVRPADSDKADFIAFQQRRRDGIESRRYIQARR